jgi:hypothetical protein
MGMDGNPARDIHLSRFCPVHLAIALLAWGRMARCSLAKGACSLGMGRILASLSWHGRAPILPHVSARPPKAKALFEKDKEYVVKGDEVMIVDEFSGRILDGRRRADGPPH